MVSENSRTSLDREPGEHKVTFTVTLACAVQSGSINPFYISTCEKLTESAENTNGRIINLMY